MGSVDSLELKWIALLSEITEPLGYEVVAVDSQRHRQGVFRIYIDHRVLHEGTEAQVRLLESSDPHKIDANSIHSKKISIDDCVKVSRAIDTAIESETPLKKEVDAYFKELPYQLEVSSPGLERPLRTQAHYQRFIGMPAKIQVQRPLDAKELANPSYQEKNPKQKRFLGVLSGYCGESKKIQLKTEMGNIEIPIGLVTKAHLEIPVESLRRNE